MPPWRRWSERLGSRAGGERGSAALEFILVGVILLVPIVYLVVALGVIQGQSLGAEAAARHIARVLATAPDAATGRARADVVLRAVVADYGMDASEVEVRLRCRPAGATCPEPGATLVVTVATRVPLPLAPPVLGLDRLARVGVEASAVQRASRYWGAG